MADFQIVVRTKKRLSVHLNLALFTLFFVPVSKEISITITMISDSSGRFRLNPKNIYCFCHIPVKYSGIHRDVAGGCRKFWVCVSWGLWENDWVTEVGEGGPA